MVANKHTLVVDTILQRAFEVFTRGFAIFSTISNHAVACSGKSVMLICKMKKINVKKIIQNQNKYVVLTKDKSDILAVGSSIKETEEKLLKLGIEDAVITYIPPVDKYLSQQNYIK